LAYTCSAKLSKAIKSFTGYIKNETLSVELSDEAIPDILPNATDEFDGEQMAIWIIK